MLGKLAIFLALACALGIGMVKGNQQKITLYNKPNCTGEQNVTFTSSQRIGAPWDRNTTSYYVFGVWKVVATNGTKNIQITSTSNSRNGTCFNKDDEIFEEWGFNPSQFRFTSAERVGPGNITTIQFNYYDEKYFQGMEYILMDDKYFTNVRMQSFAFFGNASWLLYRNYGYNDRPLCLEHQETPPGGAFTYNFDMTYQVGSVKMNPSGNCFGYPTVKAIQEKS